MDATHLTPEERAKFRAVLGSHVVALYKAKERMKARGWYTADPAYISLGIAIDALRATGLVIDLADKLPPGKYAEPKNADGAYPKYEYPTDAARRR